MAEIPEVLDYVDVVALYKACEVLELRQIINRHVFKGGGVDVGIQATKLNAENLCTALNYFYPDGKDKAVEIEKEIVGKLKELFGIKMDCLFYDITSTYFEGNETDITTVERTISRLKKEFSITDCLLIFDRGMVSEDNIIKHVPC